MIRFARLALAALAFPLAAHAQLPAPMLQPTDVDSPVERLGRYLRVLSTSPRDLEALTGAGRAALDVGDANAAIGFFARAEEVAPRDGRVKAGLASALVQMEQPKEALKLFEQAVYLGMPAASVAADRGLAFDLRGDNKRAQAEYQLALRSARSDEVVRRLALSQAMSGDRAAAMATLDPLLRKQDKAAWRASTFVLALTGDARGAVERVGLLVPAAQAQQIAPFLGRLAALDPGEQAQAVHFGHLPSGAARPTTALASAAPVPRAAPAPVRSVATPAPIVSASPAPVRSFASPMPAASTPAVRTADAGVSRPIVAAPAAAPIATGIADRVVPAPTATAPHGLAASVAPEPGFSGLGGSVLADARPAAAATTPVPAVATIPPVALATTPPAAALPVGTGATPARVGPPAPAAIALADLPPSRPASVPARTTPAVTAQPAVRAPASEVADVAPPRRATPTVTASPAVRKPAISVADVDTDTAPASRRTAAKPKPETRLASLEPVTAKTKARAAAKPADDEVADEAKAGGRATTAERGKAKGKAGAKLADADTDRVEKGKGKTGKLAAADAKADKKAKPDPKKAKAEAEAKLAATKAKKEPERHWVQVATGAYKGDLPKAWAKVQAQYPKTMAGKAAWTTPLRFTNRVLVGPFKSADEAQGFVNANAKAGFTTSRFTSPAGQPVERLGK